MEYMTNSEWERLNTIYQFLTENKGKIICIFAGYKDKLQKGPFLHQTWV